MPLPYLTNALRMLSSEDQSQVNASLSAELLGIDLSTDDGGNKSEVDTISKRLAELQEELLTSLKEDLSEWIVKTLAPEEVSINTNNFIEALDTGIILCKLSAVIDKRAHDILQQGANREPLPSYKLHCDETATSGTWYARDNTANFLRWCRAYGMTDEMLFDTEDLVTHHHERQVIYCLMELARLAARFGLEPPSLISMEREIDSQVTTTSSQVRDTTLEEDTRATTLSATATNKSELSTLEGSMRNHPSSPKLQESILDMEFHDSSMKPQVGTEKGARFEIYEDENVEKLLYFLRIKGTHVYRVTLKYQCEDHVNKLSEGVFDVYGKRVFIRLLQGKHVMVRVGGGWDTFENYLLHHNPIQAFRFNHGREHRCVFSESIPNRTGNKEYLVIRSKYKSNSFCS